MLIFAFIIASSERGRGGAGFRGGRFFRLFNVAELPDCSSCRAEEGGGAGLEVESEGRGGREFARKVSDFCASHQSSTVWGLQGAARRGRLRMRVSVMPFL